MSIMYCEAHDRKWDSDWREICPLCKNSEGDAEVSDTPRTNSAKYHPFDNQGGDSTDWVVDAEFSENLERENNKLKAENEVLCELNTAMNKVIREGHKEAERDARDAAAEAMWKERQGEDYGSY